MVRDRKSERMNFENSQTMPHIVALIVDVPGISASLPLLGMKEEILNADLDEAQSSFLH